MVAVDGVGDVSLESSNANTAILEVRFNVAALVPVAPWFALDSVCIFSTSVDVPSKETL